MSFTSTGKAKTVWVILFEDCLKVSLVKFLLTMSSLRWKMFSIRLRSGECAGILNKQHPTTSTASLDTLEIFSMDYQLGETAYLFVFSFTKNMWKLFFNKLSNLFYINPTFVWVTFTIWYYHHKLCYTSRRTFLFSLSETCHFEFLTPFLMFS